MYGIKQCPKIFSIIFKESELFAQQKSKIAAYKGICLKGRDDLMSIDEKMIEMEMKRLDSLRKSGEGLNPSLHEMIRKRLTRWKERNAAIWHVSHHLEGNYQFFKYSKDYKEYLRSLCAACILTGVQIIDFVVMLNHVHLLLLVPSFDALSRFLRSLNTSFSRKKLSERNNDGEKVMKSSKVFSGAPYCTPIGTIRQLFECLRYIHNNPVKWNLNHPDNRIEIDSETGFSWKSSAYNRARGYCGYGFNGNLVLQLTGMKWNELLGLYKMERGMFNEKVSEIERRMKSSGQDRVLKIDPDKEWTSDIMHMEFPDEDVF
ncbi:MAG: transposase [Sphaerochaetaceae bacterium]